MKTQRDTGKEAGGCVHTHGALRTARSHQSHDLGLEQTLPRSLRKEPPG